MEESIKSVTLIGSGNVATVLGSALFEKQYVINCVYSRNLLHAELLAAKLKANKFISSLKQLNTDSDLYIVAVNDDEIAGLAKQISLGAKVIVHTSGSIDMNVLKNSSLNYGVLYPLQTLKKGRSVENKDIPLCLEGSNEIVLRALQKVAKKLSMSASYLTSEERRKVHLSAVIVNNFVNHLLFQAKEYLNPQSSYFSLLIPLINETVKNALTHNIKEIQTGPARRLDIKTMDTHLEMLNSHPHLKEIYKTLSTSITKTYNPE